MPERLTLGGPVTCPECGRDFAGTWNEPQLPAEQHCPDGHLTSVTWPGWTFEPETVVVAPLARAA